MQDQKKVGPNLKDVRLKLNKNWIPVWLKKPSDFRPTTKMPNFRLTDHQIQAISAYIWQSGFTDDASQAQAGERRARKRIVRNARMSGLPLDRRRRSDAGRNVRREPDARRREGELRLPRALDSQRARSARVPTVRTKRKISVPRITPRRAFPTSSISTTASAPTTATNCKCRT